MMNTGVLTLLIATFIQIFIGLTTNVLADHLDPTARTNVNKVDPLFKKSVGDFNDFEKTVDNMANKGIENAGNKQAYKDLTGGKDAERKAAELNKINASDLQTKGQIEYAKDPTINGIFIDYSKPGMMTHREDAKRIADATAKLNENLLGQLKKLGINCRTVKGNKIINPEYFIEISNTTDRDKGDTVYDKFMCEQLSNHYSCSDSLTLTCLRKGMKYEAWQDKTIEFDGSDIYWNHGGWMESIKWKARRFGQHMNVNSQGVRNDVRYVIAQRLGVSMDNIYEHVDYDARGFGGEPFHLEGKSYTWPKFLFKYKYRDGKLICMQWHEDWTERCRLN